MADDARQRRLWPAMVCIAAAVVLGAACLLLVRPALRRARIRRLMTRHREQPTQQTARALTELLDRQEVSERLGSEILELLVTPEVAVRAAYPAGQPVNVTVTQPVSIAFERMRIGRRWHVTPSTSTGGGHGGGGARPGGHAAAAGTRTLRLNRLRTRGGRRFEPGSPGSYQSVIEHEWGLWPRDSGGAGEATEPLYRCSFEIPVAYRIVEPQHAERIERRTGPQLDEAVRAAVRLTRERWAAGTDLPSGERYQASGRARLEVGALPENVGFRFAYRDQGGMTVRVPDWAFRRRAHLPEAGTTLPLVSLRLPPGRYVGTAILEADEAAAYPDAAIKTVWGGTLELPISFIVTVTPTEDVSDATDQK